MLQYIRVLPHSTFCTINRKRNTDALYKSTVIYASITLLKIFPAFPSISTPKGTHRQNIIHVSLSHCNFGWAALLNVMVSKHPSLLTVETLPRCHGLVDEEQHLGHLELTLRPIQIEEQQRHQQSKAKDVGFG